MRKYINYSILAILLILCCVVFLISDVSIEDEIIQPLSMEHTFQQKELSKTDLKNETVCNIEEATHELVVGEKTGNILSDILYIAISELYKKHNIRPTDEEVLAFNREFYGSMMTDKEFEEIKRNAEAQLEALEAVVERNMSPDEAYEKYLKSKGYDLNFKMPLEHATQKQLDGLRSMVPSSKEDLFEKSIEGNREFAKIFLLGKQIFPATEQIEDYKNMDFFKFEKNLHRVLLTYAKENLVGKHPDFMQVTNEELDALFEKQFPDRPKSRSSGPIQPSPADLERLRKAMKANPAISPQQ